MELCDLPALESRQLIGRKEISPVELLESYIARTEAVNPTLNAIVATNYERGRAEAREAEAAVMRGDVLGPLHGLPVGVKDLQETKDIRTTYGSPVLANYIPAADEAMVALLRSNGGIVVAKTNTSEFGSGGNTTNEVYGATGNAFDPVMTCGGSSGGSGVALATSMLPLCTGSDTGGSLRKPAAWSGVVGLRPSPGLVPSDRRKLGWQPLSVLGPMGRTVADTHLLLRGMISGNSCDPFAGSEYRNVTESVQPTDLSVLRVAISVDFGFAQVAPSIARTFGAAVAKFRHLFREVQDRNPQFEGIKEIYRVIRSLNFAAAYKDYYERGVLGPNTRKNYEESLTYSLEDVAIAHREQTRIYRDLQNFFNEVDLIIVPCQLMSPYPKAQLFPTENEGMPMSSYMDSSMMTAAISLTGHPSISIPCGLDARGLPFGLQLVAPHKGDMFLLNAAAALEQYLEKDEHLRRPIPDIAKLSVSPH